MLQITKPEKCTGRKLGKLSGEIKINFWNFTTLITSFHSCHWLRQITLFEGQYKYKKDTIHSVTGNSRLE